MNIIGINAFHGDSAACLYQNGRLVAAAEEERFRRIKHWAGFPSRAIAFCLQAGDLTLQDVDVIAINSDARSARWDKIKFVLSGTPSFKLITEKLRVRGQRKSLREHVSEAFPGAVFAGEIVSVEHHLAHLASAYCVSGFAKSAVISVDGFGDFASAAWGVGDAGAIDVQHRVAFPHSLGIFYQAMTQYLGFPHYGDEYKIMGLAPYGQPRFALQMDQILSASGDGGFRLNLDYFCHHKQAIGYEWNATAPVVSRLFTPALEALLGPSRDPNAALEQHHKDLARSIQDAYERVFFAVLAQLHRDTGLDSLAIAGGCGMNSVANGKVHLRTPFKHVYVQSAAGDAGGAIGAAIVAGQRRGVSQHEAMRHAYWGPSFAQSAIDALLAEHSDDPRLQSCEIQSDLELATLYDIVSDDLIKGRVVGWFQGAMEWGPRALGNRSILGDPRRSDMKDLLNLKIKRRESFRPFAPSVLEEHVGEWFESDAPVPFMMKVFQIKARQRAAIPAVCHVDGSGRLQTVSKSTNERYWCLIDAFYRKTGVPMVLNTSFNENEPVVCQPSEALDCFLRTNMDVLVLGTTRIYRVADRC